VGALTDSLRRHATVGIDTSIFIYQLEDSDRYASVAEEALDALAHGVFQGVTSVLTLMEVAVRPLQLGRTDVADDYELLLGSYPHLAVVELDRATARRAAVLRATYRLRPADALHVAACLESGATAFLTNDKGLRRVNELEVIVLDDYVAAS
jgi:predicted nucleic acid-binding protein